MKKKLSFILAALVLLPALNAGAQTLVNSPLMGEARDAKIFERLGIFASLNFGFTPYTMTFENKIIEEALAGGQSSGYSSEATYVERKQRMYTLGAIFGVSMELVKKLEVTAGIGAYYINLEDTDTAYADYTFDLIPSPGFASFVGISWEPALSDHISFVLGLQVSYLSAFGLSGFEYDEHITYSNRDQSLIVTQDTTDMKMHLFYIQPHLGFEWRPVSSFVANSFGLYYSATLSAASMRVVTRQFTSDYTDLTGFVTDNGDRSSRTVDLWVKPIQPLGAYYGWYFIIPHSGTLGLEFQLGNRWNVAFSYQYEF
jgi:hypothetical protein